MSSVDRIVYLVVSALWYAHLGRDTPPGFAAQLERLNHREMVAFAQAYTSLLGNAKLPPLETLRGSVRKELKAHDHA